MNSLLEELLGGIIKGETVAMDATFIKAWSRRDTADDSHGFSDPESRVGRDGKTYDLGYKAHIAVDVDSDMSVAVVVASANENEHFFDVVEIIYPKSRAVLETPDMEKDQGNGSYYYILFEGE